VPNLSVCRVTLAAMLISCGEGLSRFGMRVPHYLDFNDYIILTYKMLVNIM